ncbi:hypothetical protein [Niallia sp. FSL R7-0271]|uniref:hypothetical protein n=1 Tax=Niallia sp. FSL R7-0271 TaxID=2921678 RepID=UPI0030FA386E
MFLYQYLINPKTVRAVQPSSQFLSNKMIEAIHFKDTKYIIEYGPGTGVFTERLSKEEIRTQ